MRPCNCKDEVDAKALNEQGIGHNEWGITVMPNIVEMRFQSGTIRIPMSMFKMMAEWYMKDQGRTCNCKNGCSSSTCDKR